MPSFWEQVEDSRRTNLAVRALEAASRALIVQVFGDWENGLLTDQSVRWKLEQVVRDAYRSAAAVGLAHISAQAGIPRWKPRRFQAEGLRSQYLEGLLADVRRNLREYKASNGDLGAKARAVSRISHSAGVAASRGHTDATVRAAQELAEEYGYVLRKMWQANFTDHVPCELCADLHGAEVGLDAGFPTDLARLKVYGDLKGPPRHPRCLCWIVILFVGLENFDEDPEDPEETERETLSVEQVQNIPQSIFGKLVRWLRKLVAGLRRIDDHSS